MRCVPISPFVDAPQMKKLPASSQNAGACDTSASVRTVAANGLPTDGGGGRSSCAPYGARPRSYGRSRTTSSTSGSTTVSATTAAVPAAYRQPHPSTIQARSGRKISCPVAFDAVRRPVTRPRRSANHRFAIMAPSGTEIAPVAVALTKPHSRSSCHGASIKSVSPEPAAIPSTATVITRRRPKRSASAAPNGPPSP